MLVEFTVMPVGTGESLGDAVSEIMKIIDESGLPYRVNPMGTVVEGNWEDVMALIRKCHDHVASKAPRIITGIKIDDRPGKPMDRIVEKVKTLERRLGRELKK
ncbi:MAG: MTH1187 family thiamine-binding protein [Deltaproteobacteria bacterium]|nr:MTH1187 family thiamine-binding protein [Deltaproteobacteria bacterium]